MRLRVHQICLKEQKKTVYVLQLKIPNIVAKTKNSNLTKLRNGAFAHDLITKDYIKTENSNLEQHFG